MKKWGLITLIAMFLAEGAALLWLSSERKNLVTRTAALDLRVKAADSRETDLSLSQQNLDGKAKLLDRRESQLGKQEGEFREQGERLSKQQKELDGRQDAVSRKE